MHSTLYATDVRKHWSQFNDDIDGTITANLKGFDIVENADNEEEVLDLIAEELVEYANEYLENFNLYFNAPNRRHEFPYIMNILIQKDIEKVKGLINA